MAQRPKSASDPTEEPAPRRGPSLEPLRTVRRELVSPKGRKIAVDVPVYPPFRLEPRKPEKPPTREPKQARGDGRER